MKLTREDWVDAAYEALLSGGPQAVAVAALSKRLGATRGSFYHYFEDRGALLAAALDRWEHTAVDALILRASEEEDATKRLERLLAQVFREPTALAAGERHLLAQRSENPIVAETVERVITRRHAFLEACYRDLGYEPSEAADRASVAYMMFTGWLYLDPVVTGIVAGSSQRVADLTKRLLVATA